jgi:hypothetical protein
MDPFSNKVGDRATQAEKDYTRHCRWNTLSGEPKPSEGERYDKCPEKDAGGEGLYGLLEGLLGRRPGQSL